MFNQIAISSSLFVLSPLFPFSLLTKPRTSPCHHVLLPFYIIINSITDLHSTSHIYIPLRCRKIFPPPPYATKKPNPSPLLLQPNPCLLLNLLKREELNFLTFFSRRNLYLINNIIFEWKKWHFIISLER